MDKIVRHITQHFAQPLPFVKSRWLIILLTTLWVFLLAMILNPFDLGSHGNKLWIALSYTSVASVSCALVIYVFPLLFKAYYCPNKFTNGKFYLSCIAIIVIATILCCILAYYIAMIENVEIIYSVVERIGLWFIYVSFIALFPIVTVYASLKNTRLRVIQQELESSLELEHLQADSCENSIILGKSTKDPLEIPLDNLLYIEALGNYITVFFTENNSVKQKHYRETIVQIMDDLKDYPQIVRCHRSFVVNMENVSLPENTQATQLIVSASNTKIPVSRSYTKEVREKFTANI